MSANICAVSDFIGKTWGVFPTEIREIQAGSAQCYTVETNAGKYFFKVYQEKFDRHTIQNEVAVCNFLSDKGFAVSRFLESVNHTCMETVRDRVCTLQKYIDGISVPKFQVSKPQLLDSVKVLAKLNVALEELPVQLPVRFPEEWFSAWSADAAVAKHRELLGKLDADDAYHARIAEDFAAKCRMLEAFDPDRYDFSAMTVANTHGDYNTLQLIFAENRVNAVIDFAACGKLPLCWEIIRSYTLSAAECKDAMIEPESFYAYVREYIQIRPLSKSDLALMPYFYLFTLLRSMFGYKAYVEKRCKKIAVSEKDMNALQFAFWRTAMCKWLFAHAEELSFGLTGLEA